MASDWQVIPAVEADMPYEIWDALVVAHTDEDEAATEAATRRPGEIR